MTMTSLFTKNWVQMSQESELFAALEMKCGNENMQLYYYYIMVGSTALYIFM